MDLAATIVAAVAASSAVSGIAMIAIRIYLEHHYGAELENLKAKLSMRADTEHEITERRLKAYPIVVELVYRIRNMAREVTSGPNRSHALVEELRARTLELENSLYEFRIDLQRDNLFADVHSYKNTAKNLNMRLSDAEFIRSRGEQGEAEKISSQVAGLYRELEDQHKPIIDSLSTAGVGPAPPAVGENGAARS